MTRITFGFILVLTLLAATTSAQVVFKENFDNNSAGWTLDSNWAIGAAAAYSGGSFSCNGADPGSDADGVAGGGVAGVVLGGPVPTPLTGGFLYLTSPVIDTTGLNPNRRITLTLDRYLTSDYTPFMQNRIDVFDGSAWQNVYLTGSSPGVNDSGWTRVSYDISAYSNAALQVRVGYQVDSGGVYSNCGGWNVDNVSIHSGIFFDCFDSNAAGWTLDTDWEIGAATAYPGTGSGSCQNGDPGDDGDGVVGGGVAGVNIGGPVDGSGSSGGVQYLTSPVIDTTGLGEVILELDRMLNSDYTPYMQNSIDVFDGSTWNNIFITGGPPVFADADWTHLQYDVTAYSNAAFQIRVGYEVTTSGAYDNCGGWNLDNVTVRAACDGDGQPPVPGVSTLDINGATTPCDDPVSSGFEGPYFATTSASGGTIDFTFTGQANQTIVLLTGPLNVGVSPISYGTLDIGGPGFAGIGVVASGASAGFINSLFRTNGSGTQTLSVFTPSTLAGLNFTFQAVIFNSSLLIQCSNTVTLNITP